jgi:hypothetical protein
MVSNKKQGIWGEEISPKYLRRGFRVEGFPRYDSKIFAYSSYPIPSSDSRRLIRD